MDLTMKPNTGGLPEQATRGWLRPITSICLVFIALVLAWMTAASSDARAAANLGESAPTVINKDPVSLQVQLGHASSVNALDIDADQHWIVSGSYDGSLRLWDAANGREWGILALAPGGITGVAFTPGARSVLVTGFADGLHELSVPDGKVQRTFPAARTRLKEMSTSADRAVVAAHDGSTLFVWDRVSLSLRYAFKTGMDVKALALSSDGKMLALAGSRGNSALSGIDDSVVELHEAATGGLLTTLRKPGMMVSTLAFSPDGKRLATGALFDGKLTLWSVPEGNRLARFACNQGGLQALAYSPAGDTIACGGLGSRTIDGLSMRKLLVGETNDLKGNLAQLKQQEDTLTLLDAKSGKIRSQLQANAGDVRTVMITANGQLLSGTAHGGVFLWDQDSKKPLRSFVGTGQPVTNVAWAPDGRRFASSSSREHLHIWSAERPAQLHHTVIDNFAISERALAWSPDSTRLAIGGRPFERIRGDPSHAVQILDAQQGTVIQTDIAASPITSEPVYGLDYLPRPDPLSGSAALVLIRPDMRIWVPDTNDERAGQQSWQSAGGMAISPATGLVALASHNTLELWDPQRLQRVGTLGPPGGRQSALAFSPDGHWLASGGAGASLWNLDTRQRRELALPAGEKVDSVAFSADGHFLATAGTTLNIWDGHSGQRIRTLTGHFGRIGTAAFSPSQADRLLSGGDDGSTRLWSVATGRQLLEYVAFNTGDWLIVSPEGYFAASAGGADKMNVHTPDAVLSTSQFYDLFYRPDLIQRILDGEDISGLFSRTLQEVTDHPPPEVTLTRLPEDADANSPPSLCYRVHGTGLGGIGSVRVYLNGKLVSLDEQIPPPRPIMADQSIPPAPSPDQISRALRRAARLERTPPPVSPRPDPLEQCVSLNAVSGENEIRVTAFNANNTVQSLPVVARFRRELPGIAVPQLYILAIGINTFGGKDNLNRATGDARDFLSELSRRTVGVFGAGNIHSRALLEGRASKSAVLSAVHEMAQRMTPVDTFILYAASHGVLSEGQFYLVTSGPQSNGALDEATTLSSSEIARLALSVPASHQWLVLDTCHSGGLDATLSALFDARLSVIARAQGLHALASAGTLQSAQDNYQGHGLFTHALLSSMQGHAHGETVDRQRLSVQSLGSEAAALTAALSKGSQVPVSLDFGEDFPLLDVSK